MAGFGCVEQESRNKPAKDIYSRRFVSTVCCTSLMKNVQKLKPFLYIFRDFWRFEMDFPLFGCLETFLPFGTYEFSQNLRGLLE
jgi:hypothetical protein